MQFTYIAIALLSYTINTAFAAPTPVAHSEAISSGVPWPRNIQPASIPNLEARDQAIYARSLHNAALVARAEQAEQQAACWPYCGGYGYAGAGAGLGIGLGGIGLGVGAGAYNGFYYNNAGLYGYGWKA